MARSTTAITDILLFVWNNRARWKKATWKKLQLPESAWAARKWERMNEIYVALEYKHNCKLWMDRRTKLRKTVMSPLQAQSKGNEALEVDAGFGNQFLNFGYSVNIKSKKFIYILLPIVQYTNGTFCFGFICIFTGERCWKKDISWNCFDKTAAILCVLASVVRIYIDVFFKKICFRQYLLQTLYYFVVFNSLALF